MTAAAPPSRRSPGFLRALAVLSAFVVFLWVLELIDSVVGNQLDHWGITPRLVSELPDIFTAPFLHADFDHLTANTAPLFVLGLVAALRGIGRFLAVSLLIIVVSGVGVWFTAATGTITLGASGLIFGYFGYVVLRGFFDRDALGIAIGVVVALYYGSLLWGVLPLAPDISWQGHLFGLIGGVLAAWALRGRRSRRDAALS